jgi:hypothetical protein
LLIFACSKVNTHEGTLPESKYSLIKQNTAIYFADYANALRATGHKYFGQTHDGTFDAAQFGKDISTAFSQKHPATNSPAANKLLIRSWNPKNETLVDYMHQMSVSEKVAPYVLQAQNDILSSFDVSKLESKEQNMNQVMAHIVRNMDKLEAKAERDKSLSESEVVAVIIATTAAKSLTSAVMDVTTDFCTNLNVGSVRNQASSRGFWNFVRAYINVVVTIVVRVFIAPTLLIYDLATNVIGPFFQNRDIDDFFTNFSNTIEGYISDQFRFLTGHYHCYLPNDGWQCQ